MADLFQTRSQSGMDFFSKVHTTPVQTLQKVSAMTPLSVILRSIYSKGGPRVFCGVCAK